MQLDFERGHAELAMDDAIDRGLKGKGGDKLAADLGIRLIGGVDDYATQYRIGRNKYFDRYPFDGTWQQGVRDGYLAAKRDDEARHDFDPMSEFDSNGTA